MSSQLIDGPAGPLEVQFEHPDVVRYEPVVVICHPHSQYGGSMSNKVVHMLAKLALSLGLRVLRFNFRGVGQSAGSFSHGLGEQSDCLAVLDWLQREEATPIWLAGFSFGAFVAYLSHLHAANLEQLTLVAPPVRMFEFAQNQPVTIPWAILQGKQDEITDYQAVEQWVWPFLSDAYSGTRPQFHLLDEVDHFFNGKLNLLDATVRPFWQSLLN